MVKKMSVKEPIIIRQTILKHTNVYFFYGYYNRHCKSYEENI